jgi:pantetheine-phosphate adenylyltransferase
MVGRPTVAVLGGTFDRLHAGHLALLDAAFANADTVGIGLTTARYLALHPKPFPGRIRSYSERRRSLDRRVRARYPGRQFRIVPLDDAFGGSVRPGVDVLVVSEETRAGARLVNRRRRELHLPRVRVVAIPRVLGEDLRPIAGRRIRERVIDTSGRRRTPIEVTSSSNDPALLEAARRAVKEAFFPIRVHWTTPRWVARTAGRPPARLAREVAARSSHRSDLSIAIVRSGGGATYLAVATPDGPFGGIRLSARPEETVRRVARWLRPGSSRSRDRRGSPSDDRVRARPKQNR